MPAAPQQAPLPHGLRILVVDDHEDTAHALTRLLRGEGHYVTTAHTVAGAMALVAGQRPVELVVSDIGLPDGDGCELLRRLRDFYGGRDIPAVALTGHGEEGLVDVCRVAGYRQFLLKPFRFEQVLQALRDLSVKPGAGAAPARTPSAE
jgi:CheY-like chemotaxis protein